MTDMMARRQPASAWFTTPRPSDRPRARLICLPHAGAGASIFFAWGAAFQASGVEVRAVQYPGRETRLAEPLVASARIMTHLLADAWPALSGGAPCALFGHSMGALLAYELALELSRRGIKDPPRRLYLSGRNPPTAPPRLPPIHHLPDAAFRDSVAERYASLPPEVLAEPELMALLTPILRSDFQLVDEYRWQPQAPADVPLTILGGTRDPWTTEAELKGWGQFTTAPCHVRMVAGDHFFHQRERGAVIDAIRVDLEADELASPAAARRSLAIGEQKPF